MKPQHSTRKHSPFSASGAERWFRCPGSVALSEGIPDRDNKWSIEGTKGHEVLELTTRALLAGKKPVLPPDTPREMVEHALHASRFILGVHEEREGSEVLVETRIELPFIHPQMFGTFDGAVVEHFGELHVFDYKYGRHLVSPRENLQMIFYMIGLAARYDWNFRRACAWIIQPRARGYDGPLAWSLGIMELKRYVKVFKDAVTRVGDCPDEYNEGPHCHWCKAKGVCPLKQTNRNEKARALFGAV